MSNIYSKLQKARCEFQEKPLKKSGHNKFAGYHYFELGDFLPTINALLEKYNLCSHINFTNELAQMVSREINALTMFEVTGVNQLEVSIIRN